MLNTIRGTNTAYQSPYFSLQLLPFPIYRLQDRTVPTGLRQHGGDAFMVASLNDAFVTQTGGLKIQHPPPRISLNSRRTPNSENFRNHPRGKTPLEVATA